MDELFGGAFDRRVSTHRRGFSPRVDVFYEADPPRAVVAAEIPGVDISEVRLEIEGRKLLIAGVRRSQPSAGRAYQQIEIEHGPFRRVVELGAEVRSEEARASYEDGVLTVEVPLRHAASGGGRRVPIGSRRGDDEPGGSDARGGGEDDRLAGGPGGDQAEGGE
jgi:HSP20 family protein